MNRLDALLEAARGHLALTEWVSRNRPDLHRELFYLPITEMRVRLNEVTGLSIPGSESVVKGSAAYLERLIEISKQAPAGAVDNRPEYELCGMCNQNDGPDHNCPNR